MIAATGVLHHPNLPDDRGARSLRRRALPQRALGPRREARRAPRRRHRHRLDRRADRRRRSSTASRSSRSSSAPRSGSCRRRTPPTATPSAPSSAADPELLDQAYADLGEALPRLLERARRRELAADAGDRGRLPRESRDRTCATRCCARSCGPSYRAACKRLVMSPDFYDAIQQPNAEVVTEGIERVEAEGVRTRDGRLHELDVLVLATGFRVDRFLRPIQVIGPRRPHASTTVWAKRPSAYLSISIPGFPNLFMLNGPNGPVGNFSLIEVAELQLGYVLQLRRAAAQRALPRDQPERGGDRALRGRAHRGRAPHDLGLRLPQLVPRRPRRPDELAVDLRPLPRGDGRAEARGLRAPLRPTIEGRPAGSVRRSRRLRGGRRVRPGPGRPRS